MEIRTRFAPSPTGYLHVGNVRTALINYLFTKNKNGKFILRIDDTDLERSKPEYEEAIKEDLAWLGMNHDEIFKQSSRLERYNEIKDQLISAGRLYQCFETQEELETKRKIQLASGKPPIYDRAALKLTDAQKQKYLDEGRKPHYRFKMLDEPICWQDMVKGQINFEGKNISDPILIRGDGSMTYMLCSVIDDIDYKISHIIRGEDHVTNSAIMLQIFKSLNAEYPNMGHLSLIQSKDAKISKREGGFAIKDIRAENIEPESITSLFAKLGTSQAVEPCNSLAKIIDDFDLNSFSKSPANYDFADIERLNHKIVSNLSYSEAQAKFHKYGLDHISEEFFLAARPNLDKLTDLKNWWQICFEPNIPSNLDKDFISQALNALPEGELNSDSWSVWTKKLKEITNRKGKELFMPLRLAITGLEAGPELGGLLPLIGRDNLIKRFQAIIKA